MEIFFNIMGSEWIIIIFVVLILLFGTNKLPEAGKKIGKMVGEYNKAKTEMQNQIKDITKTEIENVKVDGPVETERQKLEKMAQSLRINTENKTDDELKQEISFRFDEVGNNTETQFKN